MRFGRFEYMRWAKEQEERGWPYFLAASGIPALAPEEIGLRPEDLNLASPGGYGDPSLLEILAGRYALPEERVMIAAGTSLANFIALAVSLEPGDDAIVETPAYEALPLLVEMLGGRVVPLPRRFEEGYRVEPEALREAMTPKTRIILLTSLHNPSGVAIPEETLREVGEIASEGGALVLVDEVYLEYLPWGTIPPAASLGDPFVSTSSVTKAYGLGGLRIGWMAGPEGLIREGHALHDLLAVECSAPSQAIACRFFERIDEIGARIRAHLSANHSLTEAWIRSRDDLSLVPPAGGASLFPRIPTGISSEEVVRLLGKEYETVLVPGEFFQAPGHLRIGFGGPNEELTEGLRRLGEVLDRLRAASGGSA